MLRHYAAPPGADFLSEVKSSGVLWATRLRLFGVENRLSTLSETGLAASPALG